MVIKCAHSNSLARENIIVKSFFFSSRPTIGPRGTSQLLAAAGRGLGGTQLSLSNGGAEGCQKVGTFVVNSGEGSAHHCPYEPPPVPAGGSCTFPTSSAALTRASWPTTDWATSASLAWEKGQRHFTSKHSFNILLRLLWC